MIHARTARSTNVVLAAGALLLTLAFLAGCASTPATTPVKGLTAKAALPLAQSKLTTAAPDAKLLLVQTAGAVAPTATPVWAFLFGSQKTNKTYVVYVNKGKATPASPYGAAGLSKAEWAKVPGTDLWKVDSDEAVNKALAASGAKGTPAAYDMGFVTYVPASAGTSSIVPYVWNVSFQPGTSGATTSTFLVDVKTGATSVHK
jgi:hypothetical protein